MKPGCTPSKAASKPAQWSSPSKSDFSKSLKAIGLLLSRDSTSKQRMMLHFCRYSSFSLSPNSACSSLCCAFCFCSSSYCACIAVCSCCCCALRFFSSSKFALISASIRFFFKALRINTVTKTKAAIRMMVSMMMSLCRESIWRLCWLACASKSYFFWISRTELWVWSPRMSKATCSCCFSN